jgi:hypothetical protein
MASAIARNVEMLEKAALYRDFLWRLCPDDREPMAFWASPGVMLDEIARIENETLFITEHYTRLSAIVEASIAPFSRTLEVTRQQEEIAEEMLRGIGAIEESPDAMPAEQQRRVEEVDDEYVRIEGAVRKAHKGSFGGKTDLKPLAILEKFETEFERMYDLELGVDPEFRELKRAAQEKERRELQRKAWREWHLMEMQRKVMRAIERAKIPIPRKWGKKLVPRVIPRKERTRACELLEKRRREEQRQMQLLFGRDDE